MMKRRQPKSNIRTDRKSVDKNSQISFTIQDDREARNSPRTRTGYFHPLETRTLAELYAKIFAALSIPPSDQEVVSITFKLNNEKTAIHYPSELLGFDMIVAVISDRESSNVLSESVETDKSKYVEEHINPMPHFPIHPSSSRGSVCLRFSGY